jgi:CRP/FNR family cyclic AMP-dependent transcriptional regulator
MEGESASTPRLSGTAAATAKAAVPFSVGNFLSTLGVGRSTKKYPKRGKVFSQGDPADAIFYVQQGKVRLRVTSAEGKTAVVGWLGEGDFFGEGCLAGQPRRMATAAALAACVITRVEKGAMLQLLCDHKEFAATFMTHLLSRNVRIEEDLVDQLFNSSEKRLARVLLLLAGFGKEGRPEKGVAPISQETLAEMIGTSRQRVNFFMNKFRKLGFLAYDGGLQVHSSLLSVILHD